VSKYIIGGGIAGLISAFYNKDYKIITDKIGGQMAMNNAGPRILEVNKYSDILLKDLGLNDCDIKTATIGYRINNKFVNEINEDTRKQYYMKSRCLKDVSTVPSSIMSDGKNTIKYYDIEWDCILNKLTEAIFDNIIIGKVNIIDTNNNILLVNTDLKNPDIAYFEYDKIISTIPAPIFFRISNLNPLMELKYAKKVFIILSNDYMNIDNYDYVYYPEDKYEFHRATRLKNGRIALEYTTEHSYRSVLNKWNLFSNSYSHIPIGQIISGKVQTIENVEFIGRYACWNHDIKTDDIVKKFIGGR
jgi:hypothetical protein